MSDYDWGQSVTISVPKGTKSIFEIADEIVRESWLRIVEKLMAEHVRASRIK